MVNTFEIAELPGYYFPWTRRIYGESWRALRRYVLERDGWKCRYCGAPLTEKESHIHHCLDLQFGGTNHPYNLKSVCPECHKGKHYWMNYEI